MTIHQRENYSQQKYLQKQGGTMKNRLSAGISSSSADVQNIALVHNFSNTFSIGHLDRPRRLMNVLPTQILERWQNQ